MGKALAQPIFTPIYWIIGNVSDPDNKGTEGRKVVFYKDHPDNGFGWDLVGAAGISGLADQYRISGFEDKRLTLLTGKYKVAIVKSALDNYGANPVEFDLTGFGFARVPVALVLQYGAGIPDPGDIPTGLTPAFDYIKFGHRVYQAELVGKGQEFIVSSSPRIEAKIVSATGILLNSVAMVLNEGTAAAKTYSIKSSNLTALAGPGEAPTTLNLVYDFLAEGQAALPDGAQKLTFKAANSYGETKELTQVTVAGGEPRLIGTPLTWPSPVRLKSDRQVFFQYTLSHDLNTELQVIDVGGRIAARFICNAREEGGAAGLNKLTWDLKTQQGQIISAGIYVFSIINRDNGKLLGKGRLTTLGQ